MARVSVWIFSPRPRFYGHGGRGLGRQGLAVPLALVQPHIPRPVRQTSGCAVNPLIGVKWEFRRAGDGCHRAWDPWRPISAGALRAAGEFIECPACTQRGWGCGKSFGGVCGEASWRGEPHTHMMSNFSPDHFLSHTMGTEMKMRVKLIRTEQ